MQKIQRIQLATLLLWLSFRAPPRAREHRATDRRASVFTNENTHTHMHTLTRNKTQSRRVCTAALGEYMLGALARMKTMDCMRVYGSDLVGHIYDVCVCVLRTVFDYSI